MSITAVIASIDQIIGLIETVLAIIDLVAGNASAVITIQDLEAVVRGENARFFTTIAFSDIQTIRNQFYNNWLPSITNINREITADDINLPTGTLVHIFPALLNSRNTLAIILNRLRDVFYAYNVDLHPDEVMRLIFAFIHGFGMLFHIHAVYAELRRIQIGASTLDDPRLLTDTRAVIQFAVDGIDALSNSTLFVRWLLMVGEIHRPFFQSWQWRDHYAPLRFTAPETVLNDSGTASSGSGAYAHVAAVSREARIQGVGERIRVVAARPADEARRQFTELRTSMRERERRQGGAPVVINPTPRGPLPAATALKGGEESGEQVGLGSTVLSQDSQDAPPGPEVGASEEKEPTGDNHHTQKEEEKKGAVPAVEAPRNEVLESVAFFDVTAVPVGAEEFVSFSKALLSA